MWMVRVYRILIGVALWAVLVGLAHAATSADYLAQLQQRARALDLAASPTWRALLHYESDWLGAGVTSTVASDWFFLAAGGRHDPQAELAATLAAFFSNQPISPQNRPPRCALPARYMFLVQVLTIDSKRLPQVDCPDYQQWLDGLAPASVNLVFPAAYPNSPSSMFGHTLLRINSQRSAHTTPLLSYAVNFAAHTHEDNGLVFAVKGLAGGYPGVYGVFPYYRKVKQYAWIENRDIWDYPLRLEPAQRKRMVAHLWAMLEVQFHYYFLSKNCAYQLLALIDVAKPRLHLTAHFDWYAIPIDTIRALRQVPGLLGTAEYRPSMQTELRRHASQLDTDERQLALAVARGQVAPDSSRLAVLPASTRAGVLEVAHDYLYYRFQQGSVNRDRGLPRARAILLARSTIHDKADFAPIPVPDTPPDKGHKTLRLAFDGSWRDDVFSFGLRLRPAYHDLLDNPAGYTDGAAINFLDLGLRLRPDTGDLRINDLTLIDITSLAPRGELFKPISWQIGTGLRRRPSALPFADAPNNLGYYLQGGPGLAWGQPDLLGYVFGLASLDANRSLAPAYALGAGGSVGVLAHLRRRWQLRAEAGYLHYVAGADGHYGWLRLGQQWNLMDQLGLRFGVAWVDTAVGAGAQVTLGLQAYY